MLKENLKIWLRGVSFLLLFILWGGELFRLKRSYLRKKNRLKSFIYYSCLSGYGSWIGIESKIEDVPVFPHGMYGIFVSDGAEIGKNAVIFQQVTIGSNTLADSRKQGSPVIGDNVYRQRSENHRQYSYRKQRTNRRQLHRRRRHRGQQRRRNEQTANHKKDT